MVGQRLVSVEVQGGDSASPAMAAAIDLATQQAACLNSTAPWDAVARPAELGDAGASQ